MPNWTNLRRLFQSHLAQTSDFPMGLEVQRAEGAFLFDRNDKPYLDLICGISVSALGHSHPRILEATKAQLNRYMHTMVYGEFVLQPQVELAAKLCEHLPEHLQSVFFLNSGSEAIEAGLKLAFKATGRNKVIAAKDAYHGSSLGAMSLMDDMGRVAPFGGPFLNIEHIHFGLESDIINIDKNTACVVLETVQAESGIHTATKSYWTKLKRRCEEVGALLILDEIQAGMGRTGRLFAFEHYGIIPDILLLAKALGGGMPLSATIASKDLMSEFTNDPILGHISTFGGHPVSCAAALESLKIITEDQLWKRSDELGAIFDCLKDHPNVVDYRRIGLWAAIELRDSETVLKAVERCLENGIITDWFLFNDKCLRVCPPLNVEKAHLEEAVLKISDILNKL